MPQLPLFWLLLACLLWPAWQPLFAQERQRLVLAGDESYVPFEYPDEDGAAKGVFVAYWRLWSEATGVEVDYRLMPWKHAMQAVLDGEADAVAAMFHSEARDEIFDFSLPYFTIATHVFLHESVQKYEGVDDLRRLRVGVVEGDLAQEYLAGRLPELELRLYPTHAALAAAALEEPLDAFVADTQVALHHLRKLGADGAFAPVEEALYVSRVRAAVREGDVETLALLDRGMRLVPHDRMELLLTQLLSPEDKRGFPWPSVVTGAVALAILVLLVALWNWLLRRQVKRAERAMEQSEQRFREIFDNSFQFMAMLDPEGRVLRLNKATLQRLPYDEDCQGRPFWDIPGWRENVQAHPELRKALLAAAEGQAVRLELEVRDEKGALFLDMSLKPLRNSKGRVELLIAEARDLSARKTAERELQAMRDTLQQRVEERTRELSDAMVALQRENDERQRAEEALRSSEEKYRLLVENAGEGIVVLQGKTLRYCNPKIVEMSGYSYSELVGQPFLELVHPEDRAMVATNYQARLQGETAPEKYDFRIIDKHGRDRWMELVAVRFEWEGAPATLNLLNDISERKTVEHATLEAKRMAEDANRIMSDFVSMVSHELRTPMTSVLGFAKMIGRDFQRWFAPAASRDPKLAPRAARIEENLRIIIDESDRLGQLINDVLDLARLESDRYEWQFEPTPLEVVVDQALGATAPLFQDTKVATQFDIAAGMPEVPCDRKGLVQVLVNLIANAAKFTDEGHVRISVRPLGDDALVSVCDTGCGIAPEDQLRIFERFQQAGELLTDKPRGTGLGLSICKEIVERHGGSIWVDSTPGEGSCFHFTLPLEQGGQDEEPSGPRP